MRARHDASSASAGPTHSVDSAPPTPRWLAMRTCSVSVVSAGVAPPRSIHTGRLVLFQVRLPRVCHSSRSLAYTATVPEVCQRGMYTRGPCGDAASAAAGTCSRYQATCGGACAAFAGVATARGRACGSATVCHGVAASSTASSLCVSVSGGAQLPEGECHSSACVRCRAGGAAAHTGCASASSQPMNAKIIAASA